MIPADFAEVFGTRNAPAEATRTGKRDGKLKQPFAIARADDALSAFGSIWPGTNGRLRSERLVEADSLYSMGMPPVTGISAPDM